MSNPEARLSRSQAELVVFVPAERPPVQQYLLLVAAASRCVLRLGLPGDSAAVRDFVNSPQIDSRSCRDWDAVRIDIDTATGALKFVEDADHVFSDMVSAHSISRSAFVPVLPRGQSVTLQWHLAAKWMRLNL